MASLPKSAGHPVDVASGMVYCIRYDAILPGAIPLMWDRYYATALGQTTSGLGYGWTNRYLATLQRDRDTYLFKTPEGNTEVFWDTEGRIGAGGVIRNLDTFKELTMRQNALVLTKWDVERGDIERYIFSRFSPRLESIENGAGQALDLRYDAAGRLTTITQRGSGRALEITYNSLERIARVMLDGGSGRPLKLVEYEYDTSGFLRKAYDALGHADSYEYDAEGRLRREVMKDGGLFTYLYDDQGRCVYTTGLDGYDSKSLRYLDQVGWTEVTDSLGHITRFQHLPSGQVVQEVSPMGAIREIEYDEYRRIISVTDPLGGVTRYAYDEAGNRSEMTDALGNTTHFDYNNAHLLTQVVDAAGHVWTKQYDEKGLLLKSEDPLHQVQHYHWSARGLLKEVVFQDSGKWMRYEYNEYGDQVSVRLASGATWRYAYDIAGRRIQWQDPAGQVTHSEYDALGQLRRLQWPDDAEAHCEYDAGGHLTRFIDETGKTVKYAYGPCGRLRETIMPDGQVTTYKWGSEPGWLLEVNYEGLGKSVYTYDAEGRRLTEACLDGRLLTYAYNAAGHVVGMSQVGEDLVFERDLKGRLIRKQFHDGTSVQYAYDELGNLVEVANEACAVSFKHDAAGRVVEEKQGAYSVQSRYDDLGNRVHRQTSLAHQATFSYDQDSCLTEVVIDDFGKMQFSRDVMGREVRRRVPGGVEIRHAYDRAGRMLHQQAGVTRQDEHAQAAWQQAPARPFAASLLERTYEYDAAGQVTVMQEQDWGNTTYTLDRGDRLSQIDRTSGVIERLELDGHGRIVRRLQQEATTNADWEEVSYDRADRIVEQGAFLYEYDAQGRLIRRVQNQGGEEQAWLYAWNAQGQLARFTDPQGKSWTYTYDGLGRRISREGPDRQASYVWDGDTIVHELEKDDVAATHLFFPRTLIPLALIKQGRLYSCVTDYLGTPRELIDEQGAIVWSQRLTAWGLTEARGERQVAYAIRFCGQWYDEESKLHYNRFRMYDPHMRAYLSPDPLRLRAGTHVYRYTSNPTGWVDPLGLNQVPPPDSYSPPHGYQETHNASWDTGSSKPPMVEMSQSGSELTVHYVRRPDDFPHRGSDLVVATHQRAGLSTPESVVLKNVINQETLDQLNNGTPPRDTLLGRFGLRLARAFGIQNPEVTVEDRRAQTCIVVR